MSATMVVVICDVLFRWLYRGVSLYVWNHFTWYYLDHIYGSDNAFVWLYASYHHVLAYSSLKEGVHIYRTRIS
jgi:hypothetical protein